jgi:hypothetical protein
MDDPFQVFLTCYRVLSAFGDERAVTLLADAYTRLQQRSARLGDAALASGYLAGTRSHWELARLRAGT